MNPERVEKNKQDVINLVEQMIPTIKAQVESDAECVILDQAGFAVNYEVTEILLLGAFVKYCGMYGKRVEIIVEKKEGAK